MIRQRAVLLAALLLAPGGAIAHPVDRYVAEHNGMRIELTAPRADIVRVRIGHPALPEDASWAVPTEARARLAPLEITQANGRVELRTAVLTRMNAGAPGEVGPPSQR